MTKQMVKLGEVVDILSGFAFKSEFFTDSEGLPIIRIRDVVRGYTDTFYTGPYTEQFVVNHGDILIGMDGNFNAAKWNGGRALLNQRVCKVTARAEFIDEDYLFHYLPTVLKKIEDATPFVTVKHLSSSDLKKEQIPLPSLVEQRRIAAILDKAYALRTKRHEALAQLDRLAQSIFVEMFGDPIKNEKGLPVTELENLCRKVTDGTHQSPSWASEGIPFLFISNIVDGEITFDTEKFISETTYDELTKRSPIEKGDVLFTTVGSYGNTAVVSGDRKFCFQRHIAHIKPNIELLDPYFCASMLKSSGVRRQIDLVAKGVAQKTVNLADLKKLQVFAPSQEKQKSFTKRLDAVYRIKQNQKRALAAQDRVLNSLQIRAFAGDI